MDMPQAPGQMPAEGAGETELCLKIKADGTMTVYQEGGATPGPERQVGDIGEALKALLEMYRAMDQGDGQDQFAAGFGKAGPKPSAAPPREMMA